MLLSQVAQLIVFGSVSAIGACAQFPRRLPCQPVHRPRGPALGALLYLALCLSSLLVRLEGRHFPGRSPCLPC